MHCMDCGNKLKDINHNASCTKYYCEKCERYWYKSTRVIVEWSKKKE